MINPEKIWREYDHMLTKTFVFETYDEAWKFISQCAPLFVRLDHHPKWINDYNTVTFEMCTKTAGNKVTEKDWELAHAIDKILEI